MAHLGDDPRDIEGDDRLVLDYQDGRAGLLHEIGLGSLQEPCGLRFRDAENKAHIVSGEAFNGAEQEHLALARRQLGEMHLHWRGSTRRVGAVRPRSASGSVLKRVVKELKQL